MFARVAFPLALPEALTYAVPGPLEAVVTAGVRVRARLRGTPRVGLVVSTSETTELAVEKVQPLDEALDADPLVPAWVLELVRFAAEYYVAPIGAVLRAAVPAQLLRLPPALLMPGPRGQELRAEVSGDERRLLERVLAAPRITMARLRAEGWDRAELAGAVAVLEARHAVRLVERRPATQGGPVVTAVALTDLDPCERAARVVRAAAQRRVVAWLEELGRPCLEAELLAACTCGSGVVASLVEKGVVRRFQQSRLTTSRRWELPAQPPPRVLTPHQERACAAVADAIQAGGFRPVLMFGVTGSGKTEVYLRLAARVAAAAGQTIILVPEIALTPALAGQLSARFGERVALLHSSMAEGERSAAWERARRGLVDVVAGPRSALWAPVPRLGLVVVDEEQDASYKQDEEPRYHARDLALVLGQRLAIPVLLASATPSLDVLALAEQGRLEVLELPERVAGGCLPAVELVDLRGEEPEPGEHGQRFVSRRLRDLLADTVSRGEQAILLVNRRGWAPVLLCRECGHQAACRDCSIPLTVHRRRGLLLCHYCGYRRAIPERCPRCSGEVLDFIGAGTEKIATKVREIVPEARVDVLDRDTARSPAQLIATLERFSAGSTNVLVGTQMVSKGHHFPAVTLTGVINADNLLGFPDFRGAERTFHMLTQVAGRAGRGERPGTVIIQTYHPEHHAIRAALGHDVKEFAAEEMQLRRAFRYPPCSRMVLVRFESASESAAIGAAQAAVAAIDPVPAGLRVMGPAPAPLARLRGKWRVQALLVAPTRAPLRAALARITAVPLPHAVHRVIDVDPQTTV